MTRLIVGAVVVWVVFSFLSGVFDKECLQNDKFCEPMKAAASKLWSRL